MTTVAPPHRRPPVTSANPDEPLPPETTQIVSFRLANEQYGIDIMRVQEVILLGQITEMPEVPDYIRGMITLRGHVIPIVDLRRRFNLPAAEKSEHTRIAVINVGKQTMGIIVDAVNEVLRISADQIEPPPSGVAGMDHAYVRGLVQFDDRILILLNIEGVFSAELKHAAPVGAGAG